MYLEYLTCIVSVPVTGINITIIPNNSDNNRSEVSTNSLSLTNSPSIWYCPSFKTEFTEINVDNLMVFVSSFTHFGNNKSSLNSVCGVIMVSYIICPEPDIRPKTYENIASILFNDTSVSLIVPKYSSHTLYDTFFFVSFCSVLL